MYIYLTFQNVSISVLATGVFSILWGLWLSQPYQSEFGTDEVSAYRIFAKPLYLVGSALVCIAFGILIGGMIAKS